MKILVADDDAIMRKTIEIRLQKDGHTVIPAADGREALALIASTELDMVITDMMMPYASGLEIIGGVLQRPGKKIPILVLSGLGQENIVLEAFQLGADDYVTKPFSPNELSLRVKKYTYQFAVK